MTQVQSKKPPHLVPVLLKIFNGCPHRYRTLLAQAVKEWGLEVNRALMFPLSQAMETRICNLPHKVPSAPELSRDDRLKRWFEVCVEMGADPHSAIQYKTASAGLSRLFKIKTFNALLWWQRQGVEGVLTGPPLLEGEPTTLATLAFLEGSIKGLELFLPGSHLTHHDKLWDHIWDRENLPHLTPLVSVLSALAPPPVDCFVAMAKAHVNLSNVENVLRATQCLVDHGVSPNAQPDRPAPLSVVIRHMNSPAAVQVIDYLLFLGADPLAPVSGSKHEKTIVEFALDQWIKCPSNSHLREPKLQCVKRMIDVCSPQSLLAIFTPARQEMIEQSIRDMEVAYTQPTFSGKQHNWSVERDLATLRAWWLDMASRSAPASVPRPRF